MLALLVIEALQLRICVNNLELVGTKFAEMISAAGIVENDIRSVTVREGVFDTSCAETMSNFTSLSAFVVEENASFADVTVADGCAYRSSLLSVEIYSKSMTVFSSTIFSNCVNLENFICPNIDTIGNKCFEGCLKLNVVWCPQLVTIQERSFYRAGPLRNVTFDKVELGGFKAFRESAIENAEFPALKSMDSQMFCYCHHLVSVNIPLVEKISEYAFYDCISLIEIRCPSLTYLSASVCDLCQSLVRIDIENVTYIGDASLSVTNIKELKCESATYIGSYACCECPSLVEVYLPNAVGVSYWAFSYCTSLRKVTIPKAEVISEGCFCGCIYVENIDIPKVIHIGARGFDSSGLTECVVNSATDIGQFCFSRASKLTTLKIPQVRECMGSLCGDCILLEEVVLGNITMFGPCAFANCHCLRSISFIDREDNIIFHSLCFYGCSTLQNFTQNGCIELGHGCFARCASLITVTFKNIVRIRHGCFEECHSLKTIEVPNVKHIDDSAFEKCLSIKQFTSSSELKLGARCFYQCACLETLDIGNVTTIGPYCFAYCVTLMHINMESLVTVSEHAFDSCVFFTELVLPSCTHVEQYAFKDCQNLNITLPELISAADYAFYHSNIVMLEAQKLERVESYVFYLTNGLQNLSLPGLREAGDHFIRSTNVRSVSLPSLQKIGNHFMENEYEVEEIDLRSLANIGSYAFNRIFGVNTTTLDLSNLEYIDSYFMNKCPYIKHIKLSKVKELREHAFNGCAFMNLTMESLEKAGSYCFANCVIDCYLAFPRLKQLSNGMFINCSTPPTIHINLTFGEECFYNCSLTNATINAGIEVISTRSFAFCSQLHSVSLSAKQISEEAFLNCTSLVRVQTTSNLSRIHQRAFFGCAKLQEITFQHVTHVGQSAFAFCSSLTDVSLDMMSRMEGRAFEGCDKITTLHFPGLLALDGDAHFSGCKNLESVHLTNVQSIDKDSAQIFNGCNNLHTISILSDILSRINSQTFVNTGRPMKDGSIDLIVCLESEDAYSDFSSDLSRLHLRDSVPKDYDSICPITDSNDTSVRDILLMTLLPVSGVIIIVAVVVVIYHRKRDQVVEEQRQMLKLSRTILDDFG